MPRSSLRRTRSAGGPNGREQHIPRPMNSFICFRSSERWRAKERTIKGDNRTRSAAASAAWRELDPQERAYYEEEADRRRAEHQRLYPGYEYRPQRADRSKKKTPSPVGMQRTLAAVQPSTSNPSAVNHLAQAMPNIIHAIESSDNPTGFVEMGQSVESPINMYSAHCDQMQQAAAFAFNFDHVGYQAMISSGYPFTFGTRLCLPSTQVTSLRSRLMARQSDTILQPDAIVNQITSTKEKSKKRKRKERDSQAVSDPGHGSVTDYREHRRKKKKKKIRPAQDEESEKATVTNAPEQLAVVDESSDMPLEHSKKKKNKKKKRKHREGVSSFNAAIDPALPDLNRPRSTDTSAFLSAVVTAAAGSGTALQDHPQTSPYMLPATSFEHANFQNLPPGLDGPATSFSGEDLSRALQGLDVTKIADALQALGDAGNGAFLGQSGSSHLDSNSVAGVPQQPQHTYGNDSINQVLSAAVNASSGIEQSQLYTSPAATVGPARNPQKIHANRRAAITTSSDEFSNDHAHLLANKWLSATKLNELSRTIGLQYKKGKFSASEEVLLRNAVESYRLKNCLTHEQLNDVIFAKGKGKDNAFWSDITAQIPARPLVAVYHHVRRTFHPLKQQGKWMPAEDDALRQAVADLGQSWEKISLRVGRMSSDCRDRWRNHLNNREGRVFGPWSKEEEDQLTQIVTELTVAQGKNPDLDVFWTQVAARMGNSRGRQQCRIKWTDSLSKTVKTAGQKLRWSHQDAYILVHKIGSLNVNDDSEIDWKLLIDDNWNIWSAHCLQRRWLTLKRSVRGYEEMSHQEIVEILRIKKAHPLPGPEPVRSRVTSAPFVSVDAQASDVPIGDSFSFPPGGFNNMQAAAFGPYPVDAGQHQASFESFPHDASDSTFDQIVPMETPGAGPSNVDHPDNDSSSSSSSDSESDVSESELIL